MRRTQHVPVQEPWASIVSHESNYHLLPLYTSRDHIPTHGILVIKSRIGICALDDVESVLYFKSED